MSTERFELLLDTIIKKGVRLNWTETAQEKTYRAIVGDGAIEVEQYDYMDPQDGEEMTRYIAKLMNTSGSVVETSYSFRVVEPLFKRARSSALKSDVILDSMFKVVGDPIEDVGF